MAEDQASGPLSPERNESIFRNDILPDYLPETMRQADRPRMILLGGQPGAGKTAVLIASHAKLDQTGPTIRIVGDDLRSYHPQFRAFQQRDPETASQFTQLDAGRWTEKLLAAAVDRKANIVFETTMRTPENVARVIGMARAGGYDIEARAVAVNPRLSWQGNHFRFEEMLHAGDAARIPPQHIHDAAVTGLRISLEKVEKENLADRVQLRTRGGAVLYDNERGPNGWSRPPQVGAALEREQMRPMTRGDSWLEVAGMRKTLARAANAVVSGSMPASAAMSEILGATRRRSPIPANGWNGTWRSPSEQQSPPRSSISAASRFARSRTTCGCERAILKPGRRRRP